MNHTELETDLRARVAALTLEQKVALLTGTSYWTVGPEPAAGLRTLLLSDGPVGVRGQRWDERDPSANIPTTISVASTWDVEVARELGLLLGDEAIRKQVDVLLAPAVNLVRSPLGGRTFENFGEDPLISAQLGAALVRGVQAQGVAATVKHFVANDSETDRYVVDVEVDDRALRELYLEPFREIVAAGAWAVMAAYNLVHGHPMSESPLLQQILRDEWSFDGVVMSDWLAVRTVEPSAKAAIDLAMPGPSSPWNEGLVAAVREGRVAETDVDEKVLRILRLAARVGALEGIAPEVAAPERVFSPAERIELLTRAAADGMVLLRNAGGALPLDAAAIGTIAVLGPAAADARTLGGGSATVYPEEAVSPLDALAAAVGDGVGIVHVPAVSIATRHQLADWSRFTTASGATGLQVEYLDADGAVLATEDRRTALFKWLGDFVPGLRRTDVTTVRISGRYRAERDGIHGFGASGVGPVRVEVDGRELYAEELALAAGTDPIEAQIRPPQKVVEVELAAGQEVGVVLEHRIVQSRPTTKVELNVDPPRVDEDAEIERAVEAARGADAAVVMVGTSAEIETESMDRPSMALPGRQDELVRRVAAANPRTIVVLNSGSPVLMPWLDEVGAVVAGWFGGERLGPAIADVLLGIREPGGRLPVSWPREEGVAIPTTIPVDGKLHYDEGIAVGYRSAHRRAKNELFPFGHGLGYTTWRVDGLRIEETPDGWRALADVTNTGARAGRTVVQLYATALEDRHARPERWLASFAKTPLLAPDEQATVALDVPRRRLASWLDGGWTVPAGGYELGAGLGLDDLTAVARVDVDGDQSAS